MTADHVAQSRAAYSQSAQRFSAAVGTELSSEFEARIDFAVLDTFVELAHRSSGPVIDAGCGTGRVASHLARHGLDVLGVDVAPGMITAARAAHPDIPFEVAELTDLPCGAASLGAAAYWYSIITTPPDELDGIWSELHRVVAPGGVALVAFQCGAGEPVDRPNAYGTGTDLTLFHHDPDHVWSGLAATGLQVHTHARRAPWFEHESTDQAFLIATAG